MSNTIIDFHSHILPGIDDGSKSLEQSIAMLKMEAEQGIQRVVATPHFYAQSDKPEHFLRRREEAQRLLREEMAKHPGLPQLEIGAEVYYYSGISDSDILSQLTIGGTRFILVEMPMTEWTERMYRDLENISIKQNLIPIVAHVDRYIAPFRTNGIPQRLEALPVMVQANASFFEEKRTRRMALRMLKKGQIHLLGSDCHDLKDRKPNLGEVVKLIRRECGSDMIRYLNSNEDEVLETY